MRTQQQQPLKASGGMQSSPMWFLVLLLLSSMSQIHASPRSLFIYGPLSTEYVAETAQFGDPIKLPLNANLMLPPDNPWLCEYPESLENITAIDLALEPHFQFTQDIALFVSINRCSAETKARVLAQMRERISSRIKLLVLYSTNPQEFQFVSLAADEPGENPVDLQDIGVVYIPHRYASGIDLRMRMQYQGDDPRFSYEGSEHWNFPIEVTELSDNARPRRRENPSYNGGDIYWFRIILFSLLIASPCCRACYLWYAGGGRLHWRRNERGMIVGIQYIPPMPLWLTTGRPPNDGPSPVGVLTEEEFNNLPEIIYDGQPEKSESDTDEEDLESNDRGVGSTQTWSSAQVQSGAEENDVAVAVDNVTSVVDVEAGHAPPVGTQADQSEGSVQKFPIEAATADTNLDLSERSMEKVPVETLKDGDFLDKEVEQGPMEQSVDGEFVENAKDPPSNEDESEMAPSAELHKAEAGTVKVPAEQLSGGDNEDPQDQQAVANTSAAAPSAEPSDPPDLGSVGGKAISVAVGDLPHMPDEEDIVKEDGSSGAKTQLVVQNTTDVDETHEKETSGTETNESEVEKCSDETVGLVASASVIDKDAGPDSATTAPSVEQGDAPAVVNEDRPGNAEAARAEEIPNPNVISAGLSAEKEPSEEESSSSISGSSPSPSSSMSDSDLSTVDSVVEAPRNDTRQTTSTACAICIDEFEFGERLTLLPRCKHAFHRDCIHAWLIERQGCCPLCKTDVLEPDPNNSPGELDLEAPPEQRFMISSM